MYTYMCVGLLAAVAWPATVLGAASVIDNPWSVMTQRTFAAGKQLCEVLLSRQQVCVCLHYVRRTVITCMQLLFVFQGRRPVTLIGFSLGARVIYFCCQEMAKRKSPCVVCWICISLCCTSPYFADCEGIIEDVIMLGTPVPANPDEWKKLARVVAGKIVNGYCRYM